MTHSTALATRNGNHTALSRFGSDEEMRQLMVRSAAIFGIPAEEVDRPDVQASLKKATQYCLMYGYLPGVHIHMLPFRRKMKIGNQEKWVDTYQPDLGEKAWKDSADRQAQMQKFRYLVETEELTQDTVKELTAQDDSAEYSPEDKGFRARVLRSDHAEMYRCMGRPYEPSWSYGFWRKKARKDYQGKWHPDTVPTGRMPRDVAERRAYKAALMKVFSLVPLNDYEESQRLAKLSAYVAEESSIVRELPNAGALLAGDDVSQDEETGLLLWGEDDASEGHYREVDEETGEITSSGQDDETEEAPDVPMISKAQLIKLHNLGKQLYGDKKSWDAKRPGIIEGFTRKSSNPCTSSNDLTAAQADRLIEILQGRIDEHTRGGSYDNPLPPEDNPFDDEPQAPGDEAPDWVNNPDIAF